MKLIHEDATKDGLEFLYRYIFGIWLFIVLLDPLADLAYLPPSAFLPTGFLLKIWPQPVQSFFLSIFFLAALKILMIIALVCVIFNKRRFPMSILVCLLLTMYQGLIRSFGHVNHPELMLLLTTYVLTVFAAPGALTAEKHRPFTVNPYAIPFITILFIYSLTYVFAGIHRLVHGGTDIFTTDTITYWIIENGKRSRGFMWHLEDLALQWSWLHHLIQGGFIAVTVFEVLAPFYLISKTFRYAFVCVMLPFHFVVWIFMGIFFWQNIILYVLFFDPISKLTFRKK